jgi:hypothetical protein
MTLSSPLPCSICGGLNGCGGGRLGTVGGGFDRVRAWGPAGAGAPCGAVAHAARNGSSTRQTERMARSLPAPACDIVTRRILGLNCKVAPAKSIRRRAKPSSTLGRRAFRR